MKLSLSGDTQRAAGVISTCMTGKPQVVWRASIYAMCGLCCLCRAAEDNRNLRFELCPGDSLLRTSQEKNCRPRKAVR